MEPFEQHWVHENLRIDVFKCDGASYLCDEVITIEIGVIKLFTAVGVSTTDPNTLPERYIPRTGSCYYYLNDSGLYYKPYGEKVHIKLEEALKRSESDQINYFLNEFKYPSKNVVITKSDKDWVPGMNRFIGHVVTVKEFVKTRSNNFDIDVPTSVKYLGGFIYRDIEGHYRPTFPLDLADLEPKSLEDRAVKPGRYIFYISKLVEQPVLTKQLEENYNIELCAWERGIEVSSYDGIIIAPFACTKENRLIIGKGIQTALDQDPKRVYVLIKGVLYPFVKVFPINGTSIDWARTGHIHIDWSNPYPFVTKPSEPVKLEEEVCLDDKGFKGLLNSTSIQKPIPEQSLLLHAYKHMRMMA